MGSRAYCYSFTLAYFSCHHTCLMFFVDEAIQTTKKKKKEIRADRKNKHCVRLFSYCNNLEVAIMKIEISKKCNKWNKYLYCLTALKMETKREWDKNKRNVTKNVFQRNHDQYKTNSTTTESAVLQFCLTYSFGWSVECDHQKT